MKAFCDKATNTNVFSYRLYSHVYDPVRDVDNLDRQMSIVEEKLDSLQRDSERRPSSTELEGMAEVDEQETPPKRLRSDIMSFSQPPVIIITEPDNENTLNFQYEPTIQQTEQSQPLDVSLVSRMLKEAGLSDEEQYLVEIQEESVVVEKQVEGQRRSDSSDTPHSIKTTDSQTFIRTEFGIEGTMTKIMTAVHAGGPITVARLVDAAPPLPGYRARMAALCFNSILKLKQHEFIRIFKEPETLEILFIFLGSRFDNL